MKRLLIPILLLNLFLNLWGIGWGLPNRWHVDESVGTALSIGASRSLVPVTSPQGFSHPALYELLLTAVLVLYVGVLYITGYPVSVLKSSGISSWVELAERFPDFAQGTYLVSRALSGILGMLTVWAVYRLGKKLFGIKAALFGSLVLSVTMGFVGANHFAKRDVLLGLLFVLVLLYCVKTLKKPSRSYLFWAGFLSGLCMGTKHNGVIALWCCFLAMVFRWRQWGINSFMERAKDITGLILLVLLGYSAGIPMILTDPRYLLNPFKGFLYSLEWSGNTLTWRMEDLHILLARAICGPVNYILELASIFGVGLFVFVMKGLYHSIKRMRQLDPAEWVVLSTSILYFLIIANTSFALRYAPTKGILPIVSILACYGGKGFAQWSPSQRRKLLLGCAVFFYSLIYTIQADWVFVNGDTRYQATAWVRQNLPKGSTIEITKQIDRVISSEILKDYRVIYLGQVVTLHNTEIFAISPAKTTEGKEYFSRQRREGPTADYIIESFEYTGDIDGLISGEICYVPRDYFRGELLQGKYPYDLIKRFDPASVKVKSSLIPYLSYIKPLFWNPVPQIGYVSPTILVFKKREPVLGSS